VTFPPFELLRLGALLAGALRVRTTLALLGALLLGALLLLAIFHHPPFFYVALLIKNTPATMATPIARFLVTSLAPPNIVSNVVGS